MIGDKLYIEGDEDNRPSHCTYSNLRQDTSLQTRFGVVDPGIYVKETRNQS
jgi:hypothetical protein